VPADPTIVKYPGKHSGRRNVGGWKRHKDEQSRKKSPPNLHTGLRAVQEVINRFEL